MSECRDVTLEDVRETLARWQQDDKLVRPHRALEDHAPVTCVAQWRATTIPAGQDSHEELRETLT